MNAFLPSRERWVLLWQNVGSRNPPNAWYDRLKACYDETNRFYHNFQHIGECLVEFDSARGVALEPGAVEMAIWFHDSVYDSRAKDNEERSAALASECLNQAGAGRELTERVARLIMATKHLGSAPDGDRALVTDVDLTILGRDPARFAEYERQIREEYSWVEEDLFQTKRTEILASFLRRPRIYAVDWFFQKYEAAARRNLQESIDRASGSRSTDKRVKASA